MRIDWRLFLFEEIRRDSGVDELIAEHVDSIVDAANAGIGDEGYVGGVEAGATRSRGYVVTASYEAIRDNARNNTLLRVLGSS